jgi:hypothetical protein
MLYKVKINEGRKVKKKNHTSEMGFFMYSY